MPIRNWHLCTVKTNCDLKDQQLYPEICSPGHTLLTKDSRQAHKTLNEPTGGLPVIDGDSTTQCHVVDGSEHPISDNSCSSRKSRVTFSGYSHPVPGPTSYPNYYTRSDDEGSSDGDGVTSECVNECPNIPANTDERTDGGNNEEPDSEPSLKRQRTDEGPTPEPSNAIPNAKTDRDSAEVTDGGQHKDDSQDCQTKLLVSAHLIPRRTSKEQ